MHRWIPAWALAAALAWAQEPQPPDLTIKVNVDLIQVDVTVTDRSGKPVPGLTRDDFEVFRDGKRQQVQDALYVSAPAPSAVAAASLSTPAPGPLPVKALEASEVRRTFAVFVDDLSIGPGNLQLVRQALRKFVDEQIQPGDVVALYRSSNGLGLMQQLSNDKRQILSQLDRVRFRNINGVDSLAPIQHNSAEDDPNPAIAEAAVRERLAEQAMLRQRQDILTSGMLSNAAFVVRGLRELPGRKALILFSESVQLFDAPAAFIDPSAPKMDPNAQGGVRTRSAQSLANLIDLANRSGVTFYTADPRGLVTLGASAADVMPPNQGRFNAALQQRSFDFRSSQDGLAQLAEQTGGQFFSDSNDIGRVLHEAASAQEGYYLVSFKPDAGTFERSSGNRVKNHRLSVKLRKSGLRLRYRKSILGAPDAERMPAPSSPLSAALISPFRTSAIPLKLTGLYFEADAGGPMLRIFLHIDASKLVFAPGDPPAGAAPGGDSRWMVAVLDQTVLLYDQDGQPVLQQDKSHTVRAPEKSLPGLRQRGLVQVFDLKLPKPGAYQVRAAMMERASRQTGSAAQFIEAPDVPKGRFAMSDVSVASKAFVEGKPTDATPELRVFRRGEQLVYNAFLYNARRAAATGKPRLEHQLILYREGVPVFTGPRSPLEPNASTPGRPLTVSGTIVLGGNLAAGDYVLQIAFRDLEAPAKQQYALRTADFVLEATPPPVAPAP
ncbi:MAG: VWA domain-containing protein [Bryobacterales bacterium]|nr:VWA domain-containing protein [Bryobacterales bacterium]